MHISFYIDSYTEEQPNCSLTVAFNGNYKSYKLPRFIKPATVSTFNYYSKTFYDKIVLRTYGGFFDTDMVIFYYGRNDGTNDDQKIAYTIPFLTYTFVETQYLNMDGTIHTIESAANTNLKVDPPSIKLAFLDFDGEETVATITRTKRIWHRGTKSFKWLKYVTKPIINESITMVFDHEVGPEKNSYKGGIIATGVNILPGESVISTFIRYAEQHNMVI